MKNLYVQEASGPYFRPYVDFNAETGICVIAGESHLEDAFGFYKELQDWVESYEGEMLIMRFKLTFFNTASSKGILGLIKSMKKKADEGVAVQIVWYYPKDNYDLKAEAEDYMEDVEMHFTLIPYQLD
jgi:predicted enzyme related to lactoylglutathione lyase